MPGRHELKDVEDGGNLRWLSSMILDVYNLYYELYKKLANIFHHRFLGRMRTSS